MKLEDDKDLIKERLITDGVPPGEPQMRER